MRVGIIDYGMGNLHSVQAAVRYLGASAEFCSNPDHLADWDALVLPGVGSYRYAVERLRSEGWDTALRDAVDVQGRPLLGICLGMQILGTLGYEDGQTKGLGIVDGSVTQLDPHASLGVKIPHIGFNTIYTTKNDLFRGMPAEVDVYFNHSYCFRKLETGIVSSTVRYGIPFVASFQKGHVYGCQFHPEKSQMHGLNIIRNFLDVGLHHG